jgi:predicted ATP-grasp superfamily ATP-dependent carboligase
VRKDVVIVTDGEQRASLAVVRSLGSAGYRCVVTSSTRGSIASSSRYCERSVFVADSLKQPELFASQVRSLAEATAAAVVIPMTEQAVLALLPARDVLAPAMIPFAELSDFLRLSDKQLLLDEARKLGIDVPAQLVIDSAQQLDTAAFPAGLNYPVVVKPSRSIGGATTERRKLGVSYAADARELRATLARLPAAAFPVLVQQRVNGPGMGVFLLIWDGQVRATFAHRRLSEKPPSGGVSVYCESVDADARLVEASRALLARFNWRGVAMVEYKRDARTGKDYLMEVNGRFWGSLQLAIDAGVNFPRLLVAAALGEQQKASRGYRVGVRSRWWWGQVDHVVGRVRRRPNGPPIPPGTISLPQAVTDLFFGPFRSRDYEEVLSWNDPLPFVSETLRWLGGK